MCWRSHSLYRTFPRKPDHGRRYTIFSSALLYATIAIGWYIVFIGIPDLAKLIASASVLSVPEDTKATIDQTLKHQAVEWTRPVIAFIALIALFGFERSPL